ncbi:MAG: LITAF-like zinc ribbon domain-containing protein, partial [Pyrinomonadaceae bacterium]
RPAAQPAPNASLVGYRCPHCQSAELPVVARKISTAGWIVFFSLLIICFPLCFAGLFIKDEYRMCPWCRGAVA